MPLSERSSRLAESLFSQKREKLHAAQSQALGAIHLDFAQRGHPRGGGVFDGAVMAERLKFLSSLADARIDAYLEAYEADGKIPEGTEFERILQDAAGIVTREVERLYAEFPARRAGIEAERDAIHSRNRRDFQIKVDKTILSRQTHVQNKTTVFISCGQVTEAELRLGSDVSRLVKELTPFEPYFAQNQQSLEGLTKNILDGLERSVGLIAIMHPRGQVISPFGKKHVRASVWIEQEIAIAAFITQVLKRPIKVSAYIHGSIYREGMRDQLQLNPFLFKDDDEVLDHLRRTLPNWVELHGVSPHRG